jgi:serine protease AprX
MLKKTLIMFTAICLVSPAWSKAIVDLEVASTINTLQFRPSALQKSLSIPVIIFLHSKKDANSFVADLKKMPVVFIKKFDSIPVVFLLLPANVDVLNKIANHPMAKQISFLHGGYEELELSQQAILLRASKLYPTIDNWWNNGYTGQHGIAGILDSGIAYEHPSLSTKHIIIRQEPGSGYESVKNGVRSAHGTGVACIYAGLGNPIFPNDIGISPDVTTIVTGLAGEGDDNKEDIIQTLSSLDWMLNRAGVMPDVINYSFGNGPTNCLSCSDWSGLAKIIDYVVNHYHILLVKSAGNGGYVTHTLTTPYAATMTIPADNYNALTVANINPTTKKNDKLLLNPNRNDHTIYFTSSRGPTLNGRKKPDLSAPGNDTRTCAPAPEIYDFIYTSAMDYHDGYRLMGGTSSAAPHVGAATLLLHDAGITSPLAKKALLINSADAYTDSDKVGPDDPQYPYEGGHYPVMGSEWNRTYGWGYLNMQKAFDERNYIIEDTLTLKNPAKIYDVNLPIGAKITLVHERRVGYSHGSEWQLSHLRLELIDPRTNHAIKQDDSAIDTVHQLANCQKKLHEQTCSSETKPIHVLVKVTVLSDSIDGADEEPYALASSVAINKPLKTG